jgi:hypothetical protein
MQHKLDGYRAGSASIVNAMLPSNAHEAVNAGQG